MCQEPGDGIRLHLKTNVKKHLEGKVAMKCLLIWTMLLACLISVFSSSDDDNGRTFRKDLVAWVIDSIEDGIAGILYKEQCRCARVIDLD